jgi:TonB-dependent Receptor Plug Domain
MKLLLLLSLLLQTGSIIAWTGPVSKPDTLPATPVPKQVNPNSRLAPAPMIMPGVRLDTNFNALPVQSPAVGRAAPAWLRDTATGSPMYIIDGRSATVSQLRTIRKTDVASINVLDGGRAAELYGKNARNGMVIITTRKAVNR